MGVIDSDVKKFFVPFIWGVAVMAVASGITALLMAM